MKTFILCFAVGIIVAILGPKGLDGYVLAGACGVVAAVFYRLWRIEIDMNAEVGLAPGSSVIGFWARFFAFI